MGGVTMLHGCFWRSLKLLQTAQQEDVACLKGNLPEIVHIVYIPFSCKLIPISESWGRMPAVSPPVLCNRLLKGRGPILLILGPCLVGSLHKANDRMLVVDRSMFLEISIVFVP